MKNSLLRCLLLVAFTVRLEGQTVNVPIQNFSPKEYGKYRSAQNLCVVQDKLGFLYFGNANGVLQYDGRTWQFIPVKNGAYVCSLAVDSSGTVYVGTHGDFGLLEANENGKLVYRSLLDKLQENDLNFSNIIKTHCTTKGVMFQSQEKIFIYTRNAELKVIDPSTSFHTSFAVGNDWFVRERKSGLKIWSGSKFEFLAGSELFADLGIFAALPFDKHGGILLATMEMGVWVFHPKEREPGKRFIRLVTSNEQFILKAGIYGGIRLSTGDFALNSLNAGVIVMDSSGLIKNVIDKDFGLRVNDVKQLIEDEQHNLWLALNNGISRISYLSPLSYYSDESNLMGAVHDVLDVDHVLFVATSNGLFFKQLHGSSDTKFFKVEGVTNQIWDLCLFNNELIAAGDDGIFRVNKFRGIRMSDLKCRSLKFDALNEIWWLGNETGLKILRKNFELLQKDDVLSGEVISVQLTRKDNSNTSTAWVGTSVQGVFKVTLKDFLEADLEWIGFPAGLTNECIYPFILDSNVVFGSSAGVYEYRDKFVPSPLFKNISFDDKVSVISQAGSHIWMAVNNRPMLFNRRENKTWTIPFLPIDKGQIHCLVEDQVICWIGTDDGLIRFDTKLNKEYDHLFPVYIRKVVAGKDSVVFYGYKRSNFKSPLAPTFPYTLNAINFQCSAIYFDDSQKNQYAYRLIGEDTTWTSWTEDPKVNYTNLSEGDYMFEVKAKNVYEKESTIDRFSFSIRPPIYRTWWAYALYLFLFFVGTYCLIAIRTKKLLNEKLQLEKIIEERTREVVKQKHLVEEKHKEITDSINYAERIQRSFLASKQLLDAQLKNYFIFFQPKDVVSGDFYWASKLSNENFAIVTADSTGHGVPGAIMSILNITCLEKAVEEEGLVEPAEILNHTRKNIIERLKRDGSVDGGKDGMDCSLISLNLKRRELIYSAANNPIWVVRNGVMFEFESDKMPVGKHDRDAISFHQHVVVLEPGDMIYTLTDGMPDQFGGERGKKFMYKRLKEFLIKISNQDVKQQRFEIENAFAEWKGSLEQVDDVTVIGIKI